MYSRLCNDADFQRKYSSGAAHSYYTDKLCQIRAEIDQLRREIGEHRSAYSALASVVGLADWIFGSNDSGWISDQFRPEHKKLVSRLEELERDERYYAPLAEMEAYQLAQANANKARMEEEAEERKRKEEERKRKEEERKHQEEERKRQKEEENKRQKEEERKRREEERKRQEAEERKRREEEHKRQKAEERKRREAEERKARQVAQEQAAERARKEVAGLKVQEKAYSGNENIEKIANPCAAMLRRFPIGTKVSGRVLRIEEYGAFVEIATGIVGLVHNTELSWTNRDTHASEMLNIGDEVQVAVSKVTWNDEKKKVEIALSIRQTKADPWPEVVAKYAVGSVVKGKVLKILEHGALVELEDSVCGFVHISEISDKYIEDVGTELSVGQKVEARVVTADVKKRSIKLSMRAVFMPQSKGSAVSAGRKITGVRRAPRGEMSFDRSTHPVKLDIEEGRTVEFKKSLVFSPKTNGPDPDQLTNIAKEIAAFMNTDGGDLYLGVNDDGYVVGVSNDFTELNSVAIIGYHGSDSGYDPYKPTHDGYILKITNLVKFMLGKSAAMLTSAEFKSVDGVEYVKIHVEPMTGRKMAYLGRNQDLYVRSNSSVMILVGEDRDNYRDERIAKSRGI